MDAQGIVGRQARLGLGRSVKGLVTKDRRHLWGRFLSCTAYEVWYKYPGLWVVLPALDVAVLGHLLVQHDTQAGFLLLQHLIARIILLIISSSPGQGHMSVFWHTEQDILQQTQQPQLDQNQDFRLCHRFVMFMNC